MLRLRLWWKSDWKRIGKEHTEECLYVCEVKITWKLKRFCMLSKGVCTWTIKLNKSRWIWKVEWIIDIPVKIVSLSHLQVFGRQGFFRYVRFGVKYYLTLFGMIGKNVYWIGLQQIAKDDNNAAFLKSIRSLFQGASIDTLDSKLGSKVLHKVVATQNCSFKTLKKCFEVKNSYILVSLVTKVLPRSFSTQKGVSKGQHSRLPFVVALHITLYPS